MIEISWACDLFSRFLGEERSHIDVQAPHLLSLL